MVTLGSILPFAPSVARILFQQHSLPPSLVSLDEVQEGASVRVLKKPNRSFLKRTLQTTGIGISPIVWQRIFDPGFTTRTQGKGREIAHTIVKAFVTQYKGIVIRKVTKSR